MKTRVGPSHGHTYNICLLVLHFPPFLLYFYLRRRSVLHYIPVGNIGMGTKEGMALIAVVRVTMKCVSEVFLGQLSICLSCVLYTLVT